VLDAASPNAAIDLVRGEGPIDLLVTDVVMPGMSGVELAVAARERRPDLPVVFVSGYTGDTTIAGSDDPATAFLAKPFDGDDLLRAVRSTLDGAKTHRT